MNTLFLGQTLIKLDSVDSTNNYAAKLISGTNVSDGTVILTYNQTSGKGQQGAKWVSKPGENLTFSIVLTPKNIAVKEQFIISKAISVALINYLKAEHQIDAKIKWPNDIYIKKSKISGILIENTLQGSTLKNTIVGIGFNVNQINFIDIERSITSLKKELNFDLVPDDVLSNICYYIEKLYMQIRTNNFSKIEKMYLENLLGLNQKLQFEDSSGEFSGEIQGVSNIGELLIKSNNLIKKYQNKEIKFKL